MPEHRLIPRTLSVPIPLPPQRLTRLGLALTLACASALSLLGTTAHAAQSSMETAPQTTARALQLESAVAQNKKKNDSSGKKVQLDDQPDDDRNDDKKSRGSKKNKVDLDDQSDDDRDDDKKKGGKKGKSDRDDDSDDDRGDDGKKGGHKGHSDHDDHDDDSNDDRDDDDD